MYITKERTSFGGDGSDEIYTSVLGDTLIGGAGWDTLDGGWGNDTYYYFKGDDCDTIMDIGGHDKLYLEGFDDDDLIELYEDKDSDYICIRYDGSTIVQIYKKNRDYSAFSLSSFKVYINGGRENNITEFFNKYKSGCRLLVQCPVRIEILDTDGNVVYGLEDGNVGAFYTDYGNFYIFEEEDGGYGKVLDLTEDYTARIVGEDTGTVKIDSRDVVSGELAGPKNFVDVPVSAQFSATLEETDAGELVLAADTDGDSVVDTKIGYDGKPVPVESIDLVQDYIVLTPGQSATLHANVKPAELSQFLQWSVEEGSKEIVSVEPDGTVTGHAVGTGYVLATVKNGGITATARCRIDVAQTDLETKPTEETDEPTEYVEKLVDGIQLSTTKLTIQLYKTDYAGFEILLQLPQNYPIAATTYSLRGSGVAIEEAYFTNETVRNLFEILVLDDRSVLVIPTDYAVKNPKQVKEEYKSTVTVVVAGREYVSKTMTLTVKKSKPELTASVKAFNSFYSDQSRQITIKGGTATNIALNTSKAAPKWLTLAEDGSGILTLKEKALRESTSTKVYLTVDTEEWRIPAKVTLTVKNTYKARSLKLSATTVTVTKIAENSDGVNLKLLCSNKKDTLEKLNVTGITAPDGYTVENFNIEDGSFILKADNGFRKGTIKLKVNYSDTAVTKTLKLTVKTAGVTLKPSATKLTLNKAVNDSAELTVKATPSNYRITQTDIRLTTSKGKDKLNSGELDIRSEGNKITISTTENTPAKATYKLYVSAGGGKETAITISVVSGKPSVSFKASGSMDLSFPDKSATIKSTFKHYNGSIVDYEYAVSEKKDKKIVEELLENLQ